MNGLVIVVRAELESLSHQRCDHNLTAYVEFDNVSATSY